MFCYILRKAAVDEFFSSRFTFTFILFLGLQHGSASSLKAVMPLSATSPLAIGLKFLWFLIVLLLYPKSTILGLFFLDPKEICLPNQLSRGSWQKRCPYILNLISKKKLGSFNDWINSYFQSFICLPRYEHFLPGIFSKVSLTLLKRIQPILEILIILGKHYKAMKFLNHWQI